MGSIPGRGAKVPQAVRHSRKKKRSHARRGPDNRAPPAQVGLLQTEWSSFSGSVLRPPLGAIACVCQQSSAAPLGTGLVQGHAGQWPPSTQPPPHSAQAGRGAGLWGRGGTRCLWNTCHSQPRPPCRPILEAEMSRPGVQRFSVISHGGRLTRTWPRARRARPTPHYKR